MAVHKQTYRAYTGVRSGRLARFMVIPRFAWRAVFSERLLAIFYVLCFFYPLGCAVAIYLNNNVSAVAEFVRLPKEGLFEVGGRFFLIFSNVQGALALILTAFIGPGLISPDLVNGGLPLYFCRPLSRLEYVLGKLVVIVGLLAFITWVPGLLLWLLQASLAPGEWWKENLWLAGGIFAVSMIWTVLVGLLALALSAWVRWRLVAGALLLFVFFLGAGLGQAVNAILRTDKGSLLDFALNIERVAMELYRREPGEGISLEESLLSLGAMMALCLWLLARRIRACEVVR